MSKETTHRLAIIGTVGVPGKYGGFETLAENLVRHHQDTGRRDRLTIYCCAKDYPDRAPRYLSAELEYLPLSANGIQSIPYDILSIFRALRRGETDLLILGVSGCICLPVLRRISQARVICNIDGIEWKREKWQGAAKWFLRLSEKLAVRHSNVVIADNQAIADYVTQTYGRACEVIAYGGDHALEAAPDPNARDGLPEHYALALCRIEPENNVAMILEAWKVLGETAEQETFLPLVFVGNWNKSEYGRNLKARFAEVPGITLLNPVYEPGRLRAVRDGAAVYVHGHSAGGTNPSLVEMMHFGVPVLAHGCAFNRETTEHVARYFEDAEALVTIAAEIGAEMGRADLALAAAGDAMKEIADRRYRWETIGSAYFALMDR